jgi:N-acetylmuramoyl-L-alanine amidase
VSAFVPDSPWIDAVVPAHNREARRGKTQPDMLVLHYTGMASAEKAVAWLAGTQSRVSCHYVVDETGRVTQLVPEAERAWHAGVSCWHGETDLNSASVGIEIQNPGHEDGYHDFPRAQIDAVIRLSHDIVARHTIAPTRILAHSDIAPQRKIDPGEKFPWHLLFDAGLGALVPPAPLVRDDPSLGPGDAGPRVATLQSDLAAYGYDVPLDGQFDLRTHNVMRAFQRHFRPARCDGRYDGSTHDTLTRLLDRYGRTA